MAVSLHKRRAAHSPAPGQDRDPASLPGPTGFIGAGRVGTALAALLHARGVDVVAVSSRTDESARRLALRAGLDASAAVSRSAALESARIVFLTVPDDVITPLCQQIAAAGGWRAGQGVVHCSGALPSTALQAAKDAGALVASFHPLQAFADAGAAIANMPGSAFAVEGDPELVAELDRYVELLGGTSLHITAEQKVLYHAAAAVASNYMVTLAALASDLLVRAGVATDANNALRFLLPLLRGTLDNLDVLGLPAALTGPLARGDVGTVAHHIAALDESAPELAQLYRHLAALTIPLAAEKGGLTPTAEEVIRRLLESGNPSYK